MYSIVHWADQHSELNSLQRIKEKSHIIICLKFLFHFKAVAQELKVDTCATGRLSYKR